MKNFLFLLTGLISGLVNGMLGTGGGTITVPAIQRLGVDTKKSHATAIAVILPLTIVSVFFYFRQGHTDLKVRRHRFHSRRCRIGCRRKVSA